jgi:hypothetical protein
LTDNLTDYYTNNQLILNILIVALVHMSNDLSGDASYDLAGNSISAGNPIHVRTGSKREAAPATGNLRIN